MQTKLVTYLMFILLLTSFVFANTINLGTTSNTKPTITAYYQQDESKGRSVIITSSNLERLSPSPTSGIPTSMVKVSDFRYKFTPVNDLTNGDYKLTVKSADSFGNSGEDALFLFTVNRAINIILDKPKGVSTTVPYDVQVNTTVSARCKYSDASVTDFNTQGTLFDFESSTSLVTIHLLRNTLRNKNTFVICQDAFGNTEQKTFFLGFDVPFTINLQQPANGISTVVPYNALVTTSIEARCSIGTSPFTKLEDGQFFEGDQNKAQLNHALTQTIFDGKPAFIFCTDRIGRNNTKQTNITFNVPFTINVTSPPGGLAERPPFGVIVTTSIESHCTLTDQLATPESGTFFDAENSTTFGFTHTLAAQNLNKNVFINCRDRIGRENHLKTFIGFTLAFNINLKTPSGGTTSALPYNLEVTTNIPAACAYSGLPIALFEKGDFFRNESLTNTFRTSHQANQILFTGPINVLCQDQFGRTKTAVFTINSTKAFKITLLNPPNGVAPTAPYDFVIKTDTPAFCSYSGVPITQFKYGVPFDGESSGTFLTTHLAADSKRNAFTYIYCEDATKRMASTLFFIGFSDNQNTCQTGDGCWGVCEPADPDCDGVTCEPGNGCLLGCVLADSDCNRVTCGKDGSCKVGCTPLDPDCGGVNNTCNAGDGCSGGCAPPDSDCNGATCEGGDACLFGCFPQDPDCDPNVNCQFGNECMMGCPIPDPDCGGYGGDNQTVDFTIRLKEPQGLARDVPYDLSIETNQDASCAYTDDLTKTSTFFENESQNTFIKIHTLTQITLNKNIFVTCQNTAGQKVMNNFFVGFNIDFIIKPVSPLNLSTEVPYDIVVETNRNSHCSYSNQSFTTFEQGRPFDGDAKTTFNPYHRIFKSVLNGTIFIFCGDRIGQTTTTSLFFGFNKPFIITLEKPENGTVNEFPFSVTIKTSPDSYCSFTDTFQTKPNLTSLFFNDNPFVLTSIHSLTNLIRSAGGFATCQDDINRTLTQFLTLNVNVPFNIQLVTPKFGLASQTPYDVLVKTTLPTFCTFSNFAVTQVENGQAFEGELPGNFKFEHKLNQINRNANTFINCKAQNGETNSIPVFLGFDLSPPTITFNVQPSLIQDRARKFSRITVTTDDKTVCKQGEIGIEPFNESNPAIYTTTHKFNDSYANIFDQLPHVFNYDVKCTNLAGASTIQTATVTVQLDDSLDIIPISPGSFSNTTSFPLKIQTTKVTQCQFRGPIGVNGSNATFLALSTSDNLNHQTSFTGVAEGSQNFEVQCTSPDPNIPQKTITINTLVDPTPPTLESVGGPASTCQQNQLNANFNAHDNIKVAKFQFNIQNGNGSTIRTDTSTAPNVTETGLSLSAGNIYTWHIIALDQVGNPSNEQVLRTEVKGNTNPECDFVSPTGVVTIHPGANAKDIEITCQDTGSGCDTQFLYAIVNGKDSCIPTQLEFYGKNIPLSSTSKLCYRVFDKNNNTYSETRTINVPIPPSCDNKLLDSGERGIDCGGVCPQGCSEGGPCEISSDCTSKYCDNRICKTPSCDDNRKNGNEVDVDCAGDCTKCLHGKKCQTSSDCTSNYCNNGVCNEPSCTDYTRNGLESDTDCGGNCPSCKEDQKCLSNGDCETKNCENGFCAVDKTKDTDGDGMPDWWEKQYNFNINDPSDAAQDFDQDGYTNLQEYKAGTDPTDPQSKPSGGGTGPGLLPILLLILGILLLLGGIGYLIYNSNYNNPRRISISSSP
ncbi:MAG: hypothetical protein AABX70_06760, partial [Nanoarchaeota archaeon]